jgi:hypothetical protein
VRYDGGVSRERKSAAAPILAALAILLLPIAAYAIAYFQTGEYREEGRGNATASITMSSTGEVLMRSSISIDELVTIRLYPAAWQRSLFGPGAWLEERLTGNAVEIQAATK